MHSFINILASSYWHVKTITISHELVSHPMIMHCWSPNRWLCIPQSLVIKMASQSSPVLNVLISNSDHQVCDQMQSFNLFWLSKWAGISKWRDHHRVDTGPYCTYSIVNLCKPRKAPDYWMAAFLESTFQCSTDWPHAIINYWKHNIHLESSCKKRPDKQPW